MHVDFNVNFMPHFVYEYLSNVKRRALNWFFTHNRWWATCAMSFFSYSQSINCATDSSELACCLYHMKMQIIQKKPRKGFFPHALSFITFLFFFAPLLSIAFSAMLMNKFYSPLKLAFMSFCFRFFSPQETHSVAWFQLVLHLIQILAMPLDWKFSPSLNRNRLSCTLSLGPKFWNALRSPIRNWRRGEWLTNYPNSWNPNATVYRAWPER